MGKSSYENLMKSPNFDGSSIDENGIHDFDLSVLETLIKFYIAEPTVSEDNIDNKVSNVGQLISFLLFRKLVQLNQTKSRNKTDLPNEGIFIQFCISYD